MSWKTSAQPPNGIGIVNFVTTTLNMFYEELLGIPTELLRIQLQVAKPIN